jgi:hypothetical protein
MKIRLLDEMSKNNVNNSTPMRVDKSHLAVVLSVAERLHPMLRDQKTRESFTI